MAEMEFERNGITLRMVNRPGKKVPVLAIRFEDGYDEDGNEMPEDVVAYFKDDATARWFAEVFVEFMKGEEE